MKLIDFVGFPKVPRLSRDMVLTEKLDGANVQIYISEEGTISHTIGKSYPFLCGNRHRWITPENDQHGFAKWAYEHEEELLRLGPGHHFGEWWGQGINRGYGLKEKRFSLFNTSRWTDNPDLPVCCSVVPVLFTGTFDSRTIQFVLEDLTVFGSKAVPDYMNPEGIMIYHTAANRYFKKTIKDDEKPKGMK